MGHHITLFLGYYACIKVKENEEVWTKFKSLLRSGSSWAWGHESRWSYLGIATFRFSVGRFRYFGSKAHKLTRSVASRL